MSWIESHQSLAGHPKTHRAAELLGVELATVIGYLHLLWWWALDYAPDGNLAGFTPQQLCDAMRCKMDARYVISVFVTCNPKTGGKGFLERNGRNYIIHDWYDFAGKLLEKRAKDATRKKASRAGRPSDSPSDVHCDGARTVPTVPIPLISPTNQRLVNLCREKVPGWKDSPKDFALVDSGIEQIGEPELGRLILRLATYQAANKKYKNLQRALAAWINRQEKPADTRTADDELDALCKMN